MTEKKRPLPFSRIYITDGWGRYPQHLLALCHVLSDGNPYAFGTIGDPRLCDVRANQRDALVGRLAMETVQWARHRRFAVYPWPGCEGQIQSGDTPV